ncbi:MAG TPA: hypothetical protein VGN18_06665 [Jatrophihabitans sp.]|jgi:hypothetical protein|uniref:hypothetical protein n=1 Tax=Jatrophihabitans sp. TaxID=1932789 RepID=UPI002DFCC945|nr:hypothetical protein [Jatrophihabitans sp.]
MTTTMTPVPAASGAKILRLRTTDDLVAARDRHVGLRHRQVVLDLPGLAADERTGTAEKLTELLDECGCDTGARAMVAGAVLVLGGLVLATGGRVLPTLALSPLAVLGAVVGAGSGKAYGLARSRRQFRREIDALLAKGV